MKIILSIVFLVCTVTASAQTDFSGKWKLNLDKTQFNETPGAATASGSLFVEQKKNSITLQRGDSPKETLKIDSKGQKINQYSESSLRDFVIGTKGMMDEKGLAALDAVNSAADYLAKMPFVDSSKMGLQGHSFGGFETG